MERKAISERMKVASLRHWGLHICPECGNEILETDLIEWDHRQALIHGGDHDHTNIRAVHCDCHKKKSARDHKANCKVKRLRGETCQRKGPPMKSRGFDKRSRPMGQRYEPRVKQINEEELI